MYNYQGHGGSVPSATVLNQQGGLTGSPSRLGSTASLAGGSYSPHPSHAGAISGPAAGLGTGGSFTMLGNNGLPNSCAGSFTAPGCPGLSGSFANLSGPGVSPRFQFTAANSSFQLPATTGSIQSAPGMTVPDTSSFANLATRPQPPKEGSFTSVVNTSAATGAACHAKQQGQRHGSFEDGGAANSVTQPLNSAQHVGHTRSHGQPGSAKTECRDQQCAEEECDAEECGDEMRAPRDERYCCGISKRPLLPLLLVTSTVIGAVHMFMVEFPLLKAEFDDMVLAAQCIRYSFLALYVVTLLFMAYSALWQPGQLKREDQHEAYARLQQVSGSPSAEDTCHGDRAPEEQQDPPLPKRCHKTWQYPLPIRRYDHYCRWLANCIGLLNHREFVAMLSGLVAIGVLGFGLDCFLLISTAHEMDHWKTSLFLVLHLAYSLILTSLVGPIFRLHVGFISRNELANEWKRNDYYIITSRQTGKPISVNELSDDEFNERFDDFEYDKTKNPFDRGTCSNCWAFCCTPRWSRGQLGEF